MNARILSIVIALVSLLVVSGCSEKSSGDGRLKIVATTGMIEDAVANIVGDRATVEALMGPGVDPHLYKATQGDLAKLSEASIIFYNGLHLEGKMGDVFEKVARTKPVVPLAEAIDHSQLRSPPEFQGAHDPHVWFDVKLWSIVVRRAADEIIKLDTANAALYRKNADAYLARLDSLDRWVREQISSIPPSQRLLITAHDAFGYFGRAYGVEVMGLQGISTVSGFGLKDRARIVDTIVSRGVKAVFIESSVPKATIESVVEGVRDRGRELTIGGELYSDAMGTRGTPEGTYIGMVSANVNTIVKALK